MTDRPPQRDLAGVLHDVSNALTVLLGWVGEARAEAASPETVSAALAVVEHRARMARDLARQAIGAAPVDAPEGADTVTAEVVDALRIEAARAGIDLRVGGVGNGERHGSVRGSLDLTQVLTNLMLNAIAFAPSSSAVDVGVRSEATTIVWTVSDDGPGVPPDQRASIFEGVSLRPGGVGLGLRHARSLARSWGGDVELLGSTTGARFAVRWPRSDAAPPPPAPAGRPSALAGLRVLLVEDDDAVTQLVETALGARGAEVTIAGTAAELERTLTSGPFDTVLIDLSPIATDVAGALGRLRAAAPGADLVLITGSADALSDVPEASGMRLVRKPFELSELLEALKKRT